MKQRLLGFFSGFPSRGFPADIASRLGDELAARDSLVFVSAWPDDFAKNDADSDGMHNMFAERGLPFARHCVIDNRAESSRARRLIGEASCVFLMGGHPGLQARLLRDKELQAAIRESGAAVLGVSAGAINMAKRSLDTKESLVPYQGLGMADITVKPHFKPENRDVLAALMKVSLELPICAMEDDSAIFVSGGRVSHTGRVHWISGGEMRPFSDELPQAFRAAKTCAE